MLKNWNKPERPKEEELEERLQAARTKLSVQQMQIKEHKLPVFVLFEGWGTAGKGSILGKMIKEIDPRFFKVATMDIPTEEEKRKPFLYRYFVKIPEAGKFCFLDSGWMDEITKGCLHGELKEKQYKDRIDSVKRFERQLTDNGYLVMKFFFHISQNEQKKRLKGLEKNETTSWRVSENDTWQNKHYDKCLKVYDQYLSDTNVSTSPWYIVDAKNKKWAQLQVIETLVSGIETALKNSAMAVPLLQNVFPMEKVPKLSEISLDKSLTDEEYKRQLKELQDRLGMLHNELYLKKIPVVIAYEGWDAAGKGGNIKRITGALDPRGYEVHPIASPEPHEKARHYLWRFWNNAPKAGHIAIFDRTWYGRVMVERIEGFCSEADWKRAYQEINEMEAHMANAGAIVLKFWLHIDKDEQERRFKERMEDPAKQWKITEDDWRNREKYPQYKAAIDDMFRLTSTTFAPWIVLESDDKRYARIKALRIIVDALEDRLGVEHFG